MRIARSTLVLASLCAPLTGCVYLEFFLGTNGSAGTAGASSSGSSGSGGTGGAGGCEPGASESCYSGPAGTAGVGLCKAGSRTCQADRTWGACVGEVFPQPENCATPEDEDCDGKAPACKGNLLWAKRFGDGSDQEGLAIAVDGAGNVLVAGDFSGAIDFGGGALMSAGSGDIFVAKLDPAGNPVWSRRFGEVGNPIGQHAAAIAVDSTGNVVVTGNLSGSVDFGGGALTSAGSSDVFVVKLDVNGHHLWSERFGDSADQYGESVAVDGAGKVVISGAFSGTMTFGGPSFASVGARDIFVAEFDANGKHVWSRSFGDAADQNQVLVGVGSAGEVVVAGGFSGSIDLGGARS